MSISYNKGYKASGQLTISGPDAFVKAKKTAEIIWSRLNKINISFAETNTEFLGINSCHQDIYPSNLLVNETVIRLSVRDYKFDNVLRFSKEIAPVITSGPPGITGFSSGRPKVQDIIAYWPTLISKSKISTKVTLL